jgi:hypothetical protein
MQTLTRLALLSLIGAFLWGTLVTGSFVLQGLGSGWQAAIESFIRLSWTNRGCVFLALVAWPLVGAGAWRMRVPD